MAKKNITIMQRYSDRAFFVPIRTNDHTREDHLILQTMSSKILFDDRKDARIMNRLVCTRVHKEKERKKRGALFVNKCMGRYYLPNN